jgi:hypothetical protein
LLHPSNRGGSNPSRRGRYHHFHNGFLFPRTVPASTTAAFWQEGDILPPAVTSIQNSPPEQASFYERRLESKLNRFTPRFLPWVKHFDVFAPRSKLGLAQQLISTYLARVEDRPAGVTKLGFSLIEGRVFNKSLSVTGKEVSREASWFQRVKANFGPSQLGIAYTPDEALALLESAVGKNIQLTPLGVLVVPPLQDSLQMRNPNKAVYTETGWTFRAGETLVENLDF